MRLKKKLIEMNIEELEKEKKSAKLFLILSLSLITFFYLSTIIGYILFDKLSLLGLFNGIIFGILSIPLCNILLQINLLIYLKGCHLE